jgi:hypothetical protein
MKKKINPTRLNIQKMTNELSSDSYSFKIKILLIFNSDSHRFFENMFCVGSINILLSKIIYL